MGVCLLPSSESAIFEPRHSGDNRAHALQKPAPAETATHHSPFITRYFLCKSFIQTLDLRLRQTPTGGQAILFGAGHAIRFGNGNDLGP